MNRSAFQALVTDLIERFHESGDHYILVTWNPTTDDETHSAGSVDVLSQIAILRGIADSLERDLKVLVIQHRKPLDS